MKTTTLKKGIEDIVSKNFPNENYCVLVIHEETEVSYGKQKDVDFEYCEEHNIPCYDLKRDGGAIVYFKGNVSWADVRPNNTPNYKLTNLDFLQYLNKNLQEKGIKSMLEGNDILIDGYKVASGCAINLGPDFKRTFSCVQISINTDVEIIKKVCKKEMKKTPKALSDYGITQKEIIEFVENYFDN